MFSILKPQTRFKEKIVCLKSRVFYTYYSHFGPISCKAETIESAREKCAKMILEKNSSLPELEEAGDSILQLNLL